MFTTSQTEQLETTISMKEHRLNNEAYINQPVQLTQSSYADSNSVYRTKRFGPLGRQD